MSPLRVAVVCLGNICRSPMADVVLEQRLEEAGLADDVTVDSSGTGDWHVGDPMDERAAAVLSSHGYDPTRHRARTFEPSWFDDHDLVLAMDASNYADIAAQGDSEVVRDKVRMFRSFDPAAGEGDDEVPDPWYGGPQGFEDVLTTIERTADAFVEKVRPSGG